MRAPSGPRLRGSFDGKHSGEVAAAYREALFQLDWIDGEGLWYRGFARTDRRYRWVKHWTREGAPHAAGPPAGRRIPLGAGRTGLAGRVVRLTGERVFV
jgi:hypothetical protein